MAGDVACRIVDSNVGHEGAVVVAPNSLKIVPAFASRQRLDTKLSTPIDAEVMSGIYDIRYESINYYNSAPTVSEIRTELDTNSLVLAAVSGNVAGLAGAAMRGTNSAATAASLVAFSGVVSSLVWNDLLADNQVVGSVGYALNAASGNIVAGNWATTASTTASLSALSGVIPGLVWDETMTGHQTVGTVGYALNTASGNLIP